jgi:hypothetical protein
LVKLIVAFQLIPAGKSLQSRCSSEGKKVVLSQSDNIWKVNQETEARKSIVTLFSEYWERMRIKSPVSSEMFDNDIVLQDIKPSGSKYTKKESC